MTGGYGYELSSYNNKGLAPVADKWKKPEYTKPDHAARQQPYIPLPSTESYVVKRERIAEKVPTPTVIEYSRVSPVTYVAERERWGTIVPSALDDFPRMDDEFITQVQTEVSKPQPQMLRPPPPHFLSQGARPDYKHGSYLTGEYGQPESDAWSRSSSPLRAPVTEYKHGSDSGEYGGQNVTWGSRPPSHVRDSDQTRSPIRPGYMGNKSRAHVPAPVTEYHHSSQPNSPMKDHRTENNPWVRNSQPGFSGSSDWRQKPTSTYPTTQSAQTGYGSYNDYKPKEMDKGMPGGYSYRYDDDTPRNYTSEKYKHTSAQPSPPLARGAWTRPGVRSWTATTPQATTLSRPTNNINEAVNYLAGALQQSSLAHSSPQQQYYNTLRRPEMDYYSETKTIDSIEAQSRYGNMNGSSIVTESYGPTIDSNEALRRYGGAAV